MFTSTISGSPINYLCRLIFKSTLTTLCICCFKKLRVRLAEAYLLPFHIFVRNIRRKIDIIFIAEHLLTFLLKLPLIYSRYSISFNAAVTFTNL